MGLTNYSQCLTLKLEMKKQRIITAFVLMGVGAVLLAIGLWANISADVAVKTGGLVKTEGLTPATTIGLIFILASLVTFFI